MGDRRGDQMEFLIGFIGAIMAVLLLTAGFAAGWMGCRMHLKRTTTKPEVMGEQERKRLLEQQQAFQYLQNYSAERAYGMAEDEIFRR